MFLQNLKSVALPVSEIIGGTQKIWAVPDMPTIHFFPNFKWAFIRIGPVNVHAKYEVHSFTVPEIIGVRKNTGQSLDVPTAHAPFSPKF